MTYAIPPRRLLPCMILLFGMSPAAATCNLADVYSNMKEAEDHQYLIEFWYDFDYSSVEPEMWGLVRSLRKAAAIVAAPDCAEDNRARSLTRYLARSAQLAETRAQWRLSRRDR